MKLTDSQLVILSAAAKRDDGAVLPLPKSVKLNKGAITLVLKSLLKHKLVGERDAAPSDEAWREQRDGRRFALAISNAGLKTLGVEAAPEPKVVPSKRKADVKTTAVVAKNPLRAPKREGTKLSLLIDLMKRKGGATIEEAAKAIGWQHHSVRGAISGALKKKLGLEVTSTSIEGRGRVYRIPAQS